MSFSKVNVDEIEGAGPGGAVRFVRRRLGVEAFGINWIELPPDTEGREHDETDTGQEEVNVVVRGGGVYRIDGDEVAVRGGGVYRIDGDEVSVREGDFLRFDPETQRCPTAGPDGMTILAVGARRGSYEPRGPF